MTRLEFMNAMTDAMMDAMMSPSYSKEEARNFTGFKHLINPNPNCEYCGGEYKKGKHGDYCSSCFGPRVI